MSNPTSPSEPEITTGSPVIVESPYAGDTKTHVEYAKAAVKDSLDRGEYPFASHLFYTQVLDDNDPVERGLGIEAGLTWAEHAAATVVYTDHGISDGMQLGISNAIKAGRPVYLRRLGVES